VSLHAGVTTVRDCGARREIVLDTRAAQIGGVFRGSRIVSCGWTITMTGGHTRNFGGEADGEVALRQMVRRLVSRGVDFIKVMASGGGTPGSLPGHPSYTVDELRVIVETAHDLGKTVTTHCTCTAAIANSVAAGVDCIEHAMFTLPHTPFGYDPRVAEALARSGAWVTPTTQVNRAMVEQTPAGADHDAWARRLEAQQADVARLHDLGIPILAGSDAGWRVTAFETFWKELDQLVVCGLSPVEAVHAATGRVSQALGLGHHLGTIQPERVADLLLVEGDVAQDIRRLAYVRTVYQAGQKAAYILDQTL
jgi:imidazolonepropionase-like amidohydrolase